MTAEPKVVQVFSREERKRYGASISACGRQPGVRRLWIAREVVVVPAGKPATPTDPQGSVSCTISGGTLLVEEMEGRESRDGTVVYVMIGGPGCWRLAASQYRKA